MKRAMILAALCSVFLIGTGLLGCSTSATNAKAIDKEKIETYVDEITALMNKDADWHDDQNKLTSTSGLTKDEVETQMTDLLRRAEAIYLAIEKAVPAPEQLKTFRDKWSQSWQYTIQGLTLTLQALGENDQSLLTQVNDFTFKANNAKTEAGNELSNVLTKYGIK